MFSEAVVASVKEGVIPKVEAVHFFIHVRVFYAWGFPDNTKIQVWNYQATKLAIARAAEGRPAIDDVISQEVSYTITRGTRLRTPPLSHRSRYLA